MRKNYAFLVLFLWLTYPAFAQQPLFDLRREFPFPTFEGIKPGTRYVMEPQTATEQHFSPRIRRVVTTPKGPRPGAFVPVEPLRGVVFTLEKIVPYVGERSDDPNIYDKRNYLLALYKAGKEQYCTLLDYSLPVANQVLTRMPNMIDLDEFDRAKKLLLGQTIYPLIQYFQYGPDKRVVTNDNDDYVYLPKLVPVKVKQVIVDNFFQPVRLLLTYPDGGTADRSYSISMKPQSQLGFGFDNPQSITTFAESFALSDPRLANGDIKESTWKAIQKGVPQKGMTLKECRLAMGKPSEQSDSAVDEQLTSWYYSNHLGRQWRIKFVDGKLTEAQSYKRD